MSEEKVILLVDDETDILEFISYNLEKEGYKVIPHKTARMQYELLKKIDPGSLSSML
jgi:two-component system alkaline phosphatase synthesis response regulator PhoP